MNSFRTLVLDLDGTICQYSTYRVNEFGPISGECKAFLEEVAKTHQLVLHTARGEDEKPALLRHLEAEGVLCLFARVVCGKPIGVAYVDDRAIHFEGDWNKVMEALVCPA